MLRHRPDGSQTHIEKHQQVIQALMDIPELWIGSSPQDIVLDSSEYSAAGDLSPVLGKGIDGQLSYSPRFEHYVATDEASFDDFLIIYLDTDALDYSSFVLKTFPKLVTAMAAYRAVAYIDKGLALDDFDAVSPLRKKTGKDIDGRDSVYRIISVNYFDRELCRRSFNLTPEQIVERLSGHVEKVKVHDDGVLLIYSSQLLNRDEIININDELMPLLNQA